MTADFRALCEELLKCVELSEDFIMNEENTVELVDRARAALAEHQPPAAGHVEYLVRYLRDWGNGYADEGTEFHLAADLLERLAEAQRLTIKRLPDEAQVIEPKERTLLVPKAQPIPVSKRLPEAGDCDDSLCWQWLPDINGHHPLGRWELQHRDWLSDFNGEATHWLPANALPLPSGEVEE